MDKIEKHIIIEPRLSVIRTMNLVFAIQAAEETGVNLRKIAGWGEEYKTLSGRTTTLDKDHVLITVSGNSNPDKLVDWAARYRELKLQNRKKEK